MAQRKDAARDRARLIAAGREVYAEATQQIALDADEALRIEDPRLAIVALFETTARRHAADRGLYQVLAGQDRTAARATGRPPLPGSADRYQTLEDVIADTTHRAGRG
jgi:hypothetical protein